MISTYTVWDLPLLGEVELLLEGDYIYPQPTIVYPVDRSQEGTGASIDGLSVTLLIYPHEINITDSLSDAEVEELTDILIGSNYEN